MQIAFSLTLIWTIVAILVLGFIRYYKISLPKLNQWRNTLLLILEVFAIATAIFSNNEGSLSPYMLFAAIFLLLVGWIKSHQDLLLRFFKGAKKRPWLWRLNILTEGTQHSQNPYFLGDWYQIIAIAIMWKSLPSLIVGCLIYPVVVYIFSLINVRNFNKSVSEESELIKNDVWANFAKTIFNNITRSAVIVLFFIVPIAITRREWTIFYGTSQDAINLVTTLVQVEATVFALVITFLFVLVEFTNSAYSPRLVRSFTSQWTFRLMAFTAITSIMTKIWLLANVSSYINLQDLPSKNIAIDWTLTLTAFSVLCYFIFIRDTINLMQPEAIAKQILINFNEKWMELVRRNWKERNRIERLALSDNDNDPMILFERYLSATIERKDIYSTKAALALMGDRISHIMDKNDGFVIDNYLHNRLGHIVNTLADSHSDLGLEIFCGVISVITNPTPMELKKSDIGMFGEPPGMLLLSHIAEKAIDLQLLNSGRQAIWRIADRCEGAIKALPAYSELWLINPDNFNNDQVEKEKLWKNDRQLESVTNGYFNFFEKLGVKAIKNRSRELAWTVSHTMSHEILHIIELINEEPYQRSLVLNCLWSLEEIVKTSCEEKFPGCIYFGILDFGVEKIGNESTAMIIATSFARFVHLMANAGTLDNNHVRDIAVMGVYLSKKYPQATIPILNSLGSAGESFKKTKSDTRQENLDYALTEILGRIDQVEKAGLTTAKGNIRTKITLTAKSARKKSKQVAVRNSRKIAKK
ncbi:MAG: DUF2254 domain-containing protein [Anaerolineales bacterium]|nr:DUF2254 domain-containing protein [Anaerolineales bacterium]